MVISLFLLWGIYYPKPIDIMEAKPEVYLNAETLISHFKNKDENFLEAEKIVSIEGTIKEINSLNNRMTILLEGGVDESACVICDMQTDQTKGLKKFKPKDTIRLKGVFKGFLKDAIFLNCVISQRKINE
ncbi:OB-fold protein [Poritiphilus flavus]